VSSKEERAVKVTLKSAVIAMCHDCCGYYIDGLEDCEIPTCPLYQWMPYKKMKPDYDWTRYNPKMIGKKIRVVTVLSEDEKEQLATRLREAKEKKYARD